MPQIINKTSTALEASRVLCAGPAILMGLLVHNTSASAQYIQIHNVDALPANGAAPEVIFIIEAGKTQSIDYSPHGRFFQTGMVVCNSSTVATKTIGSADCWFDAQLTAAVIQ